MGLRLNFFMWCLFLRLFGLHEHERNQDEEDDEHGECDDGVDLEVDAEGDDDGGDKCSELSESLDNPCEDGLHL